MIRWAFRWLKARRMGSVSFDNLPSGAEWDPCQFPNCGIRRRLHSKKFQGHFFVEQEE